MVVLLPVSDTGSRLKIARKCQRCHEIRWRCEWESIHTNLCIPCVRKAAARRCRHCKGPVPVVRTDRHRKYCDAEECQAAKVQTLAYRGLRARQAKMGTTKMCPACGKAKPRTAEFWAVSKRDGSTVQQLDSYCRPCRAADMRARYETDEKRKMDARARAKRQKQRIRERMAKDPVFAAEMRAKKRAWERNWKQRVAEREAAEETFSSGTGPEMLVGPLMPTIDAWLVRMELDDEAGAKRLGVSSKRFREWRKRPDAKTRMSLVDSCLVGMDVLWFDVFDPAVYPDVAAIWEG